VSDDEVPKHKPQACIARASPTWNDNSVESVRARQWASEKNRTN